VVARVHGDERVTDEACVERSSIVLASASSSSVGRRFAPRARMNVRAGPAAARGSASLVDRERDRHYVACARACA